MTTSLERIENDEDYEQTQATVTYRRRAEYKMGSSNPRRFGGPMYAHVDLSELDIRPPRDIVVSINGEDVWYERKKYDDK